MNILIIVDPQNDFINGSLPVIGCENAIKNMVELSKLPFGKIITTQDWHPSNHDSFEVNGGIWPVHCVEGTPGAQIFNDEIYWNSDIIFRKGMNPEIDSYSALRENDGRTLTGLSFIINGYNMDDIHDDIYVCGLAMDFCVKNTILDIISLTNITPTLITDASKAISNDDDTIKDLINDGTKTITTNQLQERILCQNQS